MNRRDSLKALGLTTLSATVLAEACKNDTKVTEATDVEPSKGEAGREQFEIDRDNKLKAETFFDAHEMATIIVLADIIIPKDEKSGSASEAKVPDFIEFIVKDIPDHKLPMRGGLKWLDMQCLKRYGQDFKECSSKQQLEMVDQIAYPGKAKPDMKQGVAFFNRMRDLTASGFFTSKIGMADIGYVGNMPNQWKGVPDDVKQQHGFTGGGFWG
jgi:hypothetical protein